MTGFKSMQPVAVSNMSEERAIEGLIDDLYSYYYLFTGKGGRHYVRWESKSDRDEGVATYKYVVAIPEKRKIPYTFETFPKCYTLIKMASAEGYIWTIDKRCEDRVITSDSTFYFDEMYDEVSISFDNGETWQPFWLEE